jgi:hypothetical protein
MTNQAANSICLNATTSGYSPATENAFYVNPVRNVVTTTNPLYYDSTTFEIRYNSSSRRFKENIQNINIDTSKVLQIIPKEFNGITTNDFVPIGYIAEELHDIEPYFSTFGKDGDIEGVNVAIINACTLEEVKKNRLEIIELKKEIENLKKLIN